MSQEINKSILEKSSLFFTKYNIQPNTLYLGEQECYELYNFIISFCYNNNMMSYAEFCNNKDLMFSGFQIVFVKNKNYLEVGI